MKVIEATDYGDRKVIVICLNPDEPEAVHQDGQAHEGEPPAGTDPTLKCWEWCKSCRYNWKTMEFMWTGEELYKESKNGARIVKTDDNLFNEILESPRLKELTAEPQGIQSLLDRTF